MTRAFGPYTCHCGCGETRSAFNVALDFARDGVSPRNAVENVSAHFGLSEVEQEQLVDDIEDDLARFAGRWAP